MTTERNISGIGGWLLVAIVALFVFMVLNMVDLYEIVALVNSQEFQAVKDPGSISYQPYWMHLVTYDIFFYITAILFILLIGFSIIRRSRRFKSFCVALLLFNVFANIAGLVLYKIAIPSVDVQASVFSIVLALALAGIWIPYVIKSKRIRNTFIR